MDEERLRTIIAGELNAFGNELRTELKSELKDFKKDFKVEINKELASFFGQMTRYFDARFNELESRLMTKVDHIYDSVDGIAKRLDMDDQERAAAAKQCHQHEQWITRADKRLRLGYYGS